MIDYIDSAVGITPEMLDGFFEGWLFSPSKEKHFQILENSQFVILAIDDSNGKVVGFINAVSDMVLCAYVPLLEVLPDYRGNGIGSELVKKMLKKLERFYMIDLTCDAKVQPIYQSLGMKKMTGMMIRNYDRQSGE